MASETPAGYTYCTTGQSMLTCLQCGAMVCDASLHNAWHRWIESWFLADPANMVTAGRSGSGY